ncbi:MAG TPA: HDOD domain-containing protein [Thermodesulfovibrionales bacterium]|nr:HDOD domain-containing protein [Thermodesulfovibrionales bacterium]
MRDTVLRATEIPAVPMVAVKILKLIDSPDTSLDELQKAIMADQALAARILKVANSSFYGGRQNIDTISQAIAIMGFNSIRTMTLAVSSREVYKRFGLLEQKMWEHSLGVSIAAGILASESPFLKKEEAVVAGLLHDIGKVIMNNSQPERFSILVQRVHEERVPFSALEKDIFGFTHAEAGYLVAEKWGFPQRLCDAILSHHSCDAKDKPFEDKYQSSLCATVALADALCVRLGVGYRGPMADLDLGEEVWRRALGISEERFGEITTIFKNAYILEKISFQE